MTMFGREANRAAGVALAVALAVTSAVRGGEPSRTDQYGDPLPDGAVARMGTARFRAGPYLSGFAFSPDGKTIVTASMGGTLTVWEAATGKPLRRIDTDLEGALAAALAPDGKTVAAAGPKGVVGLWDVASGKCLRRLEGEDGLTWTVAFSPDGKTLATGGEARSVYLWDLTRTPKDPDEPRRCSAGAPVRSVAFSPDGKILAVAGDRPQVLLFEPITGKELRHLRSLDAVGFLEVTWAPDGGTVAGRALHDEVTFWDPVKGTEGRSLTHAGRIAYSPDGKFLAVCGESVRVEEADTGKKVATLGTSSSPPTALGLLPDETFAAFSPDGKTLAVAGQKGGVRLWDTATWKEKTESAGHRGRVWAVAASADGTRLVTGGGDGTVRLWDAGTGKEVVSSPSDEGREAVHALALSPDGKLLASGGADGKVRLWDPVNLKELRRLKGHEDGTLAVAFSPDGKVLASGGRDAKVRLWAATGEKLAETDKPRVTVCAVAFSPDGKWLACGDKAAVGVFGGGQPGRVYLWRLAEKLSDGLGKPRHAREAGGDVWAVAFSPDGKTVATGGMRDGVFLWDAEAGKELRRLKVGENVYVSSLAFSPDGKLLLCGVTGGDSWVRPDCRGLVQVWEMASGKQVRTVEGSGAAVWSVTAFADGRRFATGGADGTALVYDLTTLPRARAKPGKPEALWADLASPDPGEAYAAVWELAAAPADAVALVKERVADAEKRAASVDKKIADLDSDTFSVREKATTELAELGEVAEAALQKALKNPTSAEAKRRLRALLDKLEQPEPGPERLRWLRVVAALEMAGDKEARSVLEAVAKGPLGEVLARDAKGALERLEKRASKP
jgi:WD40 repeat protein